MIYRSLFLWISFSLYAHEQVLEGNFSMPLSQQPTPLVSFGQNIIDQGQTIVYLFADSFLGKKNDYNDVIPSVVYGIRDDLSIYLTLPFSPGNTDKEHHSAGLEDATAQLEYSFWGRESKNSSDLATLVGNVTFPTGSGHKNPPTGFGSPSFFLGATYNHTGSHWFVFTSQGALLTTSDHHTDFGNQFLYQFGLGRCFATPPGCLFAWQLELDGQYYGKNKIDGKTTPNSGGNTLFLTPSLWISTKRLVFQLGVGAPITQHWHGNQSSTRAVVDFNFGVTF